MKRTRLIVYLLMLALGVGLWYALLVPGPAVVIDSARRVDVLVVAEQLRRALPLESASSTLFAPGGSDVLLVYRPDEAGGYGLLEVSLTQKFLTAQGMVGDFNRIRSHQIELAAARAASSHPWFVSGLARPAPVQISRSTLGIDQPVEILDPGEHRTERGLTVTVAEGPAAYAVCFGSDAVAVRAATADKDFPGWFGAQRWKVTMVFPLPAADGPYELKVRGEPVATMSLGRD